MIEKAHTESLNKTNIKYGLTPSEGAILLFLSKHDFDTAKEISEYRSISKSLVSKSINNLLEQGLIKLQVDQNDKRIHRITLTKDSNKIIDELSINDQEFYELLKKGLNPEDIENLQRIMNTIYDNVRKEINNN